MTPVSRSALRAELKAMVARMEYLERLISFDTASTSMVTDAEIYQHLYRIKIEFDEHLTPAQATSHV